MKLLFWLSVVILTVSGRIYGENVPGFKDGQEYEYNYHSNVFTGVVGKVNQLAGIMMKGTILIQRHNDYIYIKMKDFKKTPVNEKYKDEKSEIVHENYSPIPGDAFDNPFRAKMEKGVVVSFDTFSKDKDSPNQPFKQAILSLLQLNITSDQSLRLYHHYEEGVGGECFTSYNVNSNPYYWRPHEKVLNVTKLRFYDKCTKRITPYFSFYRTYSCGNCEDPLQTVSSTDYSLHGDRTSYTIEYIFNSGKYIFAPFGTNSEVIHSLVNQRLKLASVSPITEEIKFPDRHSTFTSLISDVTENDKKTTDVDLKLPNHYNRRYSSKNNEDYKEKIAKYLKELSSVHDDTEDLIKTNDPHELHEIIITLGLLSFEQIKDFYESQLSYDYKTASPEMKRQKEIFYQSLCISGTNPAIMFITHVLEKGILPHEVGSKYFKLLPFHAKDHSESLLEHVYAFTKKIDKTEQKNLYKTFWLIFGTLIHDGCHNRSDVNYGVQYIRPATCEKFVADVLTRFQQATETWEQLLFLKVASNMGDQSSFKHVKDLLVSGTTSKFPTSVRCQAFFNLVSFIGDIPQEVAELSVSTFYNYSEPAVIRIAAFDVFIHTHPHYDVLHLIASQLSTEPSRQVASFVYSSFKTYANSTNPCQEVLRGHSQMILKNIPEYFYGYHYSRKISFNYFNDKFNFGGETVVSYISTGESFVPEYVYLEQSANIFGRNMESGVLIQAVGLSEISQMFSRSGDPEHAFKDIMERKTRNVNNFDEEMKKLNDVLDIVDRKTRPIEIWISKWVFGQDIGFTYMNQEDFVKFVMAAKSNMDKMDFSTPFRHVFDNNNYWAMHADVMYEVTTEFGYPLSLSFQNTGYAAIKGDISLGAKPGISVNVTPTFHMQMYGQMALRAPFFTYYGYGVTHDVAFKLPIRIDAGFLTNEKKWSYRYTPTQTNYTLIDIKTRPFTFVGVTNGHIPIPVESNTTRLIHYREVPFESSGKIGQKYFGVGLAIYNKHEYPWNGFGSIYNFVGSFFKTPSRTFDAYNYAYSVTQRVVSALLHAQHYFFVIPEPLPWHLAVYYEPNKEHPTTEFILNFTGEVSDETKDAFKNTIGTSGSSSLESVVHLNYSHSDIYRLKALLVANGKTERQYKLETATFFNKREMPWKMTLDYERSAIPGYDPEPFKLCYHDSGTYPQYQEWYSFDEKSKKSVESAIKIGFGKDCTDYKIDINTVIEKTEEEIHYNKNPILYPTSKDCKKDLNEGYNISHACWPMFMEYYTLRKYIVDIHYENLPDYFLKKADKVASWIKFYLFTNMEHVNKNVRNPANHMKIISNYSINEPKLDIQVYTPEKNMFYNEIYYPKYIPVAEHFNLRFEPTALVMHQMFNWEFLRFCTFQNDKVTTFDDVGYKFKVASNGYYLLAKDCTKDDKFAVLVQRTQLERGGGYSMILKVLLENHVIEILPLHGGNSPYVVLVDGAIKKDWYTNGTVYYYSDYRYGGDYLFMIVYNGVSYELKSPIVELIIRFNGQSTIIQTSNAYRSRVCGLCGDMNSESTRDFVGPNGCAFRNSQAFADSYLLTDNPANKSSENIDRTCV